MDITVTTKNGEHKATVPFEGASFVETKTTCPVCGANLKVSGMAGTRETTRDTISEKGKCRSCDQFVCVITVKFDTIFGIEEDNRVLNGRCRVY